MTSGDFNGDGWVDLIWQHVNGRVAVWFMRETQMLSGEVFAIIAPSSWTLRGAGDMDGDGWPDLLWQNNGGLPPHDGRQLAVWTCTVSS